MQIGVDKTSSGFSLSIGGEYFQADPCELRYPDAVWDEFPAKNLLIQELVTLLTLPTPLILRHPTIAYPTARPRFLDLYTHCFAQSIPNLVENIPQEDSHEVLSRLHVLEMTYDNTTQSKPFPELHSWIGQRVILPFTYGKDSLVSLITLENLGYEVFPVAIDERSLPRGLAIRKEMEPQFLAEQGYELQWIENEPHLLVDYQVLKRPQTYLHQVHVHFLFVLAMLPFCTFYNAPTIVLSNEWNNTLNKVHRQDYVAPYKYMQSKGTSNRLSDMVSSLTNGQVKAANLIGPLRNMAIHWLLHEHFPEYGKYRISCHMEVTEHKRWCHSCFRCAQAYISFLAQDVDPATLGFEHSMLSKEKKHLFFLFDSQIHPHDDFRLAAREEEMLAFTLATGKGAQGDLVDIFKKTYAEEVQKKKTRLIKSIFSVHGKKGKQPIEREAWKWYKKVFRGLRKKII